MDVPAFEAVGEQFGPQVGLGGQRQKTPAYVARRRDTQRGETARRSTVVGDGHES